MKKTLILISLFMVLCSSLFAMVRTVDPLGGGTDLAISDAVAAVEAGNDADNTIILANTAPHQLGVTAQTWTFTKKNATIIGADPVNRPVVVMPNRATGRYEITLMDNSTTATITVKDVIFIAPKTATGLPTVQGNNLNDGFLLNHDTGYSGKYIFENVVFSANNGSDAPVSIDGSVPYPATESATYCVIGDDWMQIDAGETTITQCVFTGARDDAFVTGAAKAVINKGTIIANNRGAGIQKYGGQKLIIDGSEGRVIIANNGVYGADCNLKTFADAVPANPTSEIIVNKADLVSCANGNYYDFAGDPATFTDCRLSSGCITQAADRGQIAFWDADADGPATFDVKFERCTIVESLNNKAIYMDANAKVQLTLKDCVIAGKDDTFNKAAAASITLENTAVATEGTFAVANLNNLPAPTRTDDPQFVSVTPFIIGLFATNADYLKVQQCHYDAFHTGGTDIVGAVPTTLEPCANVESWEIIK